MRDLFAIDGRSIWTELVRARIAAAAALLGAIGVFYTRRSPREIRKRLQLLAQRGAYKVRFGKQPSLPI
jgi:hypothetical protein